MAMTILHITFYLFPTFIALYLITKHFLHKIQNLPPTPILSFPIIGHLHLLKRPIPQNLSKLSAKHGPILLLRLGYRRVLVVSSPSAAEECLTKNDVVFANRPRLAAGKYNGSNYTNLAWAPYGDHWRNLRRISAAEVFSAHRIGLLADVRKDEVKILVGSLLKKQDRPVDMKTVFQELTLNIIMRTLTGKRYYGGDTKDSEEAARFRGIIRDTARMGARRYLGDFLPVIGRFDVGVKEVVEVQKRRDGFMQSLIEEHRTRSKICANESGWKNKTMIEVLLWLQETQPEYYTDEIVRDLVLILLMAGTDTTSSTMEWALSLLLNHPEVLEKARTEIYDRVGSNRLVEESDLPQLPYLRSIISETTRMYPTVPLLIPHESSKECTVGGFRIPSGTTLLVNVWGIQNDSKIWAEPDKFKPERFRYEAMDENVTIRDGFKLLPFGSGRRGCPGETLATRVIGLALGSLIQCFNWKSVNGKTIEMTEQAGFTLSKAEPLRATCSPRPCMIKLLSQL